MPEPQTLMTGLALGESPRWHEDRLWFSDWGAREVIAVDVDGNSEVILRVPSLPFCIDWIPDGRLLIVSGREGRLLRREPDGSLVTHADLTGLSHRPWNDIVVDGRGNAYVNNIGFDLPAGEFAPGTIAMVAPDGSASQVADGIAFPNGMVVTPDNSTLIVAESYADKLTALEIATDGTLSKGGCGPASVVDTRMVSAWMSKAPSGTATSPPSGACASGRAVMCCKRSTSTGGASPACWAARRERRCS
jgi:sugar lactone lactonase YvrE